MIRPTAMSIALLLWSAVAQAQSRPVLPSAATGYLAEAQTLYDAGQYFKAARYAFQAKDDPALLSESYAWTAISLIRAGMFQSASYFFIRTLQLGQTSSIRKILVFTQPLLQNVGVDLVRKYLVTHTTYQDYNAANRSAFLFAVAKQAILEGKGDRAVQYIDAMSSQSSFWPFALQIRGAAQAMMGKTETALQDFNRCAEASDRYVSLATAEWQFDQITNKPAPVARFKEEAFDLRARCVASQARVLYQTKNFEQAERVYDLVSKDSLVWPEVLFEQAWNAYSKNDLNRALGKLVTYKSPALQFIANPEVQVLASQSYLRLCLYSDARKEIQEFEQTWEPVAREMKGWLAGNSDLSAYYRYGQGVLSAPLYSKKQLDRLANNFVRTPYFRGLVDSEKTLDVEQGAARAFTDGVETRFAAFLSEVLRWRKLTIQTIGGAFIKNSMADHFQILLANMDRVSAVKVEVLTRTKDKLQNLTSSPMDRSRGDQIPSASGKQYQWEFNGEFWADELGDYVFGLKSECGA